MAKNFERAELQAPLSQAVFDKLNEIGCELAGPHIRRVIRATLRTAARIALMHGCPPPMWLELCAEAYVKEGAELAEALPEEGPGQILPNPGGVN
jgi:hypothetical protein